MQNAQAPEPLLFPLVNISFSMSGSDIKSEKSSTESKISKKKTNIFIHVHLYIIKIIINNHYENV